MSTQCTITGEQTSRTHGLVDTVEPCMFEGDVHELLHSFHADVEKAHAHLRPLLFGFIRRRGQVRFVILPEGSPLERAYRKDGYLVSRRSNSRKTRYSPARSSSGQFAASRSCASRASTAWSLTPVSMARPSRSTWTSRPPEPPIDTGVRRAESSFLFAHPTRYY